MGNTQKKSYDVQHIASTETTTITAKPTKNTSEISVPATVTVTHVEDESTENSSEEQFSKERAVMDAPLRMNVSADGKSAEEFK